MKSALERLDDAGHVAYVVGGSVRDFLLGKEPKDHDIATSASPDELCALFPDAITVGKAFGVLKVPVAHGPGRPAVILEIATFRQDLDYKDFRHPEKVVFAGPAEDAIRRDFTINGLFYDPRSSRVLDCVGGADDLKKGVVRAIGDPQERFKEDALRLLRAARFTASLGFKLDEKTAEAVRARAKLIDRVSAERVRDELTLMWTRANPARALVLLRDLGLLPRVLPEIEALERHELFEHTVKVMKCLEMQNPLRTPILSWATLLHEIGKPAALKRSGGKNLNGHERDGARLARGICERLRMSRAETDSIASLIEDHVKFKDVFGMREATLQRFIQQPRFDELLALHRAEATATDGNLAYYEFCASRLEEWHKSMLLGRETKLITGEDLIQLGFKPGPIYSNILRTVEDLTLEHKLQSKEEALEYVVKHFVK